MKLQNFIFFFGLILTSCLSQCSEDNFRYPVKSEFFILKPDQYDQKEVHLSHFIAKDAIEIEFLSKHPRYHAGHAELVNAWITAPTKPFSLKTDDYRVLRYLDEDRKILTMPKDALYATPVKIAGKKRMLIWSL